MRKQRGEITVFLSLVLVIMISVLFTVIEAARTNAVQFQAECVADMALQSALAEYNRELLEQYELFFIDIGYGTEKSGYELLEQHILHYMDKNFHLEESSYTDGIRDLLQLSTDSILILEAAGALDDNAEVLERKAVDYMLDRYELLDLSQKLSHIGRDTDEIKRKELISDKMERMREDNEEKIRSVDTTVEDEEGKKKKIPVNNPADKINSRRGSSRILKTVTKEKAVSDKEICLEDYISHRGYKERDGFLSGEEDVTGAEDLIFQKYIMETCGKYTDLKEGSRLDYEMEYILSGKCSDRENLQNVVNQLLVIRETANFIYLLSDSGKQAQAEAVASALAVVIFFPELKDLIKLSLLIGWAYAESVNDVTILLNGGSVPIWKDGDSWKLSLKNALKLEVEDESTGEGLSYEQYLHVLLAVSDKKQRNLRFMDIIEMNIRQTPGNENFRMDQCIHSFTAEMTIRSGTGYSCLIKRTAGYLK